MSVGRAVVDWEAGGPYRTGQLVGRGAKKTEGRGRAGAILRRWAKVVTSTQAGSWESRRLGDIQVESHLDSWKD